MSMGNRHKRRFVIVVQKREENDEKLEGSNDITIWAVCHLLLLIFFFFILSYFCIISPCCLLAM